MPPIVLTIAGSDGSGGAGVQADLRAIHHNGGYGISALTAITSQNTLRVKGMAAIDESLLDEQLSALIDDFAIDAVKVGLVPNQSLWRIISSYLQNMDRPCPVVVDPVLHSTSGTPLADAESLDSYRDLLAGHITLLTPNTIEASQLTGIDVQDFGTAKKAADILGHEYQCAVLVKGGHLEEARGTDVLFFDGEYEVFSSAGDLRTTVHGTGCLLSSAIATHLAHQRSLIDSITQARVFVHQAILSGQQLGQGQPLATFDLGE